MTESVRKFKEIVDKSDSIAVQIGAPNDISKALAGALLHQTFLKLNKKSEIDMPRLADRVANSVSALLDQDRPSGEAPRAKENVLIKINTLGLPISSLRYEKDGDFLKIILERSEPEPPDLKAISVEKATVPVDLLLLIDPAESETEKLLLATPHKDVVKLTAKDRGFALKSAEIMDAFFGEVPKGFKDALWFLAAEEEKALLTPSQDILALLARLLGEGIDHGKIKKARGALYNSAFWKLFGRALARSEYEKDISTTWVFLPKADFEKTGQDDNAVSALLSEMQNLRPESGFVALLWEKGPASPSQGGPKSIKAALASKDPVKLNALAGLMGSSPASSYFTAEGFASFSECELKIRGFIRKIT